MSYTIVQIPNSFVMGENHQNLNSTEFVMEKASYDCSKIRPSSAKKTSANVSNWKRSIKFSLPKSLHVPEDAQIFLTCKSIEFLAPNQEINRQSRNCEFGFPDGISECHQFFSTFGFKKGKPTSPLGYGPLHIKIISNNTVIARSSNAIFLNTGTKQSRQTSVVGSGVVATPPSSPFSFFPPQGSPPQFNQSITSSNPVSPDSNFSSLVSTPLPQLQNSNPLQSPLNSNSVDEFLEFNDELFDGLKDFLD